MDSKCNRCQMVISSGSSFCTHCGLQVVNSNPQPQQPPAPNPTMPQQPMYSPMPESSKSGNNKKLLLFGGLGILVILLLILVIYLVFTKEDTMDTSEQLQSTGEKNIFSGTGIECQDITSDVIDSVKEDDFADGIETLRLQAEDSKYISESDVEALAELIEDWITSTKYCFEGSIPDDYNDFESESDITAHDDYMMTITSKDIDYKTAETLIILILHREYEDQLEESIDSFDAVCQKDIKGLSDDEIDSVMTSLSITEEIIIDDYIVVDEIYDFELEDKLEKKDIDFEKLSSDEALCP